MSKLLKGLSFTIAILTSNTFALPFHSFYAAADLGIFQANFNNRYLDQTTDIPQNIVQTANQNGYTGGIALGYSQLVCAQYFLGGELAVNFENHTAAFQSGAATAAFSDTVNVDGHIDLTFMPGIKLNDSLSAYLKLGLSVAKLQDALTSPAGTTPLSTKVTANKNAVGFAGGLRLTKSINANTCLFTEADYHDYGSVDFPSFENFTAEYTHATRLYTYDVVIGVLYHF